MFAMFNIDVADKNPKYKDNPDEDASSPAQDNPANTADSSSTAGSDTKQGENTSSDTEEETGQGDSNKKYDEDYEKDANTYSPESAYRPKQNVRKNLGFTREEGQIINSLKDTNDLCNKIYNVVFELSKLELQIHRYSITCLYRTLVESSTMYLSQRQPKVAYNNNSLETSITNALNYFGNISKKGIPLHHKTIDAWRETVSKRKLIDTLNQYIHNELPVDAYFLQETWNTMKGYVIACLTIS